ncbi:hypothetical protein P7C70_g2171, partial [Phenoliferia sp. Uapishka_3]
MQEASGSGSVEREWPCLVRATARTGETKVKLSTIVRAQLGNRRIRSGVKYAERPEYGQVQPSEYTIFTTSYGAVLKGAMTSLRKKRKQKKKPEASKKVAGGESKAKFIPTLPKVIGPRRGAGASKRQRALKRRARELAKLVARKKRDRVA